MTETTFIYACKKGDVKGLEQMAKGKGKLSTKSRSKDYENLFQRGIFEMLGSKKEKEIAHILCNWAENTNELLTEKQLMALLAKGKYDVLDEMLETGLNLGKSSYERKYKSIFDKMIKDSIRYSRVEEIEYLMGKFNMEWVDVTGIIRWLANEEDMASLIDEKLTERGCNTLLNFFIEKGVSMEQIISILN